MTANYDLLITGGTVVTAEWSRPRDVAISGDKISAILEPNSGVTARRVLDAAGRVVLPGGVDPHVHYSMRSPRNPAVCGESQDYSAAAAFGGTTTIIDFALQAPPRSLHETIAAKKAEAAGRMAIDYSFHAIVTGQVSFDVLDEIPDVISSGIPTIKTLMTYGWMTDDGDRWAVMSKVAAAGGMSVVHAEDDALAGWFARDYARQGKTYGAYISDVRNALVEEAAVRRAILLAERSGSPLYVLHIGAQSAASAVADARQRGLPVYGESLLCYLSFTSDDLWKNGLRGLLWNNYPTLKSKEDQEGLWRALVDDELQVVSTDHMAYKVADRLEKIGTTIDAMSGGQAAVELRLPVLYHLGVVSGRISLNRFVELTATNPAKLMGLYPAKGQLAAGADADVVIFDQKKNWTVTLDGLHMSSDYSCWEGWQIQGAVDTTVLRGQVLVENGQWVGPHTSGQFVQRRLLPELITGNSVSVPKQSAQRQGTVAR